MSTALADVDLSSATVGTKKDVNFTGVVGMGAGVGSKQGKAHMRVFNESGCGLGIQFSGGRTDNIPAGGWGVYELIGDTSFTYTVKYVIQGAPVNLLLVTLYEPGEAVPPAPVLGNSPIGVSGQVSTAGSGGTSFIKNDANVPATSIIEATPSDQGNSSWSFNNDASGVLQVLSANVLRKVLSIVRGNAAAGKATVDIGDAGDLSITTYHGTFDAGVTFPGAQVTGTVPSATNASNATNAATASQIATTRTLTSTDVWAFPTDSATGKACRWASIFTGTGAGIYSHGWGTMQTGGVGPTFCAITANELNSTQTVGVDSLGSSTVHVNMPNAWPFYGIVERM